MLYRDPSLWEQHPRLILATVAVVAVQLVLIVGSIVQRSRRKRAEERFRVVVEAWASRPATPSWPMQTWDHPGQRPD